MYIMLGKSKFKASSIKSLFNGLLPILFDWYMKSLFTELYKYNICFLLPENFSIEIFYVLLTVSIFE